MAEALGVSKPFLYYYLKNKDDMLFECSRIATEQLHSMLDEVRSAKLSGWDRLVRLLRGYAQVMTTDFGVCLIREGQEIGQPATPQSTGCLATIEQWDVPHPNLFELLARGGARFRILDTRVNSSGLIIGKIEMLPEPTTNAEMDQACEEVLRLAIKRAGADSVPGPIQLENPVWVSYRLAEILPITPQEKQALLETNDTDARMTRLRELLLAHGIIEKINKND